MRIVYMGTPKIASDVLEKIKELPVEIVGVYTQPDKPVGRKQILTPSPVKELAQSMDIPVYQPRRIKRKTETEVLKELAPDLILVTAYGQILSEEILSIPRLGCVNLHTSLLPKYRGAAPIQWAIVNGDTTTGVTAMYMDKGMDTGDIIYQEEVAITEEDDQQTLTDKLAQVGGELMKKLVSELLEGKTLPREKQNTEQATMAPIIQKEDGKIDWNKPAWLVDRAVRGFAGWPGAFCMFDEQRKLTIIEGKVTHDLETDAADLENGEIVAEALSGKHPRLIVKTSEGLYEILQLQLQGKKAMQAEAFLRGTRDLPKHF